jgi:hypothetical protein
MTTTLHDLAARGAERVESERANKTAQLDKEEKERQRLQDLAQRRQEQWMALRSLLLTVWPVERADRS